MSYTFALVGNPNSGKTSIFNEITGSTQYVGNWPGVTVEKKEGKAKKFKEEINIVDLPGIYSLSPYSLEEIIARDYIVDQKPDVIINIIDATNIERNLYLTTQLMEVGIPVVAALNMMDVIEKRGEKIDITKIEKVLGIPVVLTSAYKGTGIYQLVQKSLELAQARDASIKAINNRIFDSSIENSIQVIEKTVISLKYKSSYDSRWVALKLLEGDNNISEKEDVPASLTELINSCQQTLEKEYNNDIETIIIDNRYRFITNLVKSAVDKNTENADLTVSDKIDKVVTNRILAIPLFLLLMYTVFQVTFGLIGTATIDWLDSFINDTIAGAVSYILTAGGAAQWLHALVVDGIIAGVGSILVFVPQIMILFFFLSILEDSGYMARAAFVMDRFLRKLGLSGKSFIPMLMGFGCNVPAIMAARTLENEKDRRLTIILTPFMSCGARLPIYALFAAAFFSQNQSFVILSIYILGIVVAVFSGILLKNTILKGETATFVMELPPYRLPTLKSLTIHMWDRGKDFIKKAGTIIFAASVIIWFCQTFNFSFQMVDSAEESIFGVIGSQIAVLFAPLGFGDWKSSVALLTGFVAKEAVVATMGILNGVSGTGDSGDLAGILQATFTPLKAYAFMAFTLLYIPCIATVAAMKREMNSWKWTIFTVAYQIGTAWLVAFIIYQGGRLIGIE